jgi:hypothetical protein
MGLIQKIKSMLPGNKGRAVKDAAKDADLKTANDRAKRVLG